MRVPVHSHDRVSEEVATLACRCQGVCGLMLSVACIAAAAAALLVCSYISWYLQPLSEGGLP